MKLQKKKRVVFEIGDIYKIHLDDNLHSYGQFLTLTNRGGIVRVFDILTDKDMNIDEILNTKEMFPPVYLGLIPAIKEGYWEKIGYSNIINFEAPLFRGDNKNIIEGLYGAGTKFPWYIIEPKGKKDDKVQYESREIGDELPDEYKKLEREIVWSYKALNDRIKLRGKIPYPAWDY